MQIVKSSRYLYELESVIGFIAEDSLNRAIDFTDRLNTQVLELDNMPYKNRVSIHSDDENVRDMIFHGYVVPYRVNKSKNCIEVLGIFNQNKWEM